MRSLSFDSMAAVYEETRVFNRGCFASALDFLAERFPPDRYPKLFEAGIGTGRIAFPLAERGYAVAGADISGKMLDALRRRRVTLPAARVSCSMADVTALPFADGVFDIAVAVHLFYFVPDWKKAADEISRVCRGDGAVVLMHTGTGTEIPFLNERYRALCREADCPIHAIGVESNQEVADYFGARGYETEWVRDRWSWTARIRLDEALEYLRSRAYAFTAIVPNSVHRDVMEKLGQEMKIRYGRIDTEIDVPNQIYLVFIRSQNHSLRQCVE